MLELREKFPTLTPGLKYASERSANLVINVGNYAVAIKQALLSAYKNEDGQLEGAMADLAGLPYRMWMKGLALMAGGDLEDEGDRASSRTISAPGAELCIIPAVFYGQASSSLELSGMMVPRADFQFEDFSLIEISETNQRKSSGRQLQDFKWEKRDTSKLEKPPKPARPKRPELKEFKPEKKVVQPGNTGCQRLGQSPDKTSLRNGREAADRVRKVLNFFSRGTSAGTKAMGKFAGASGSPFGLPQSLATYQIGQTAGYWGVAIDATFCDPPRYDYQVLARYEPGTFVPVQPAGGVTRARAEATNAYLATVVDLTARMRAAKLSIERCSGAVEAGDEHWNGMQIETAMSFARLAGQSLETTAFMLESLLRVLESESVPDLIITHQMIEDYLSELRGEGFSSEEIQTLRSLKLTNEEIEELRMSILEEVQAEEPQNLYESTRELAAALRRFAILWQSLPGMSQPLIGGVSR